MKDCVFLTNALFINLIQVNICAFINLFVEFRVQLVSVPDQVNVVHRNNVHIGVKLLQSNELSVSVNENVTDSLVSHSIVRPFAFYGRVFKQLKSPYKARS